MTNIVTLAEIIEMKVRKEQEVEFYKREIQELSEKLRRTQMEIDLNAIIIDMIQNNRIETIGAIDDRGREEED